MATPPLLKKKYWNSFVIDTFFFLNPENLVNLFILYRKGKFLMGYSLLIFKVVNKMCKIKLEEVGFIGRIRAPQDKRTHGPEPDKAQFQGHSFFEVPMNHCHWNNFKFIIF
jgi:hypothetical protein